MTVYSFMLYMQHTMAVVKAVKLFFQAPNMWLKQHIGVHSYYAGT